MTLHVMDFIKKKILYDIREPIPSAQVNSVKEMLILSIFQYKKYFCYTYICVYMYICLFSVFFFCFWPINNFIFLSEHLLFFNVNN